MKPLTRPYYFILFLFVISQSTWGQVITGVVTDSEDIPLIGANVIVKQSDVGTITDIDGSYSLELQGLENPILEVSYIGYVTQSIPVNGQTVINVTLSEDSEVIEEVVITGYKKEIKSDVSSAITSIKTRDIENLVVVGIDQAMQGQAPGVQVTQVTGAPGDDVKVRIRGTGTFGNNDPLYVIDGVPTTGNINMFSPSDIESIEILKDGAAAAIYGSRAANGVVLITTNRGKAGESSFEFEAYTGLQQPIGLPELLNSEEYLTIRNEAINNANVLRNPANQIDTYDPAILDDLPDTDWLDLVFNPAMMQRYALSGSGGGQNGRFYISGEYLDQDGIYQGQGFEKYQVRFNGEINNDWFRVGNSLSFSHTFRDVINSSGDGFGPGNQPSGIRYALIAAPVVSPEYPDGTQLNTTAELDDPVLYGDGNPNPVAFNEHTDWTIGKYRVFGNVYAELDVIPSLTLRTTLGGDFLFEHEKLFVERLSAAIYSPTALTEGRVTNRNLIWNNTAIFEKEIQRSRFSTLLGMEAIQNRTDYLGASANNFSRTDPLFRYISASNPLEVKNIGASGIATEWALLSYFGQVSYSFDSRYVINATLRYDGSSRFGENNRWGLFPSVSAAWNISNEPFFENIRSISTLKLRGSWGQLGNQEIGIYPFSSLVSNGDRVYVFGNNNVVTGASIVEAGNQNIKWEVSTQLNFGLDLSILRDKLSGSIDVFDKTTNDILVRVPLPQAGGDTRPPFVNAAKIQNRGLEVGLLWKDKIGQVGYNIGANYSMVRNKVISLADSEPILGGYGLSDGALTRTEVGHSVGSFYLWRMEGLFQSEEEIENSPFQSNSTRPGDVRFADLNDDNVIDDKDREHVGNPFPDFTYGVNLGLNWKGFDLSTLIQGVQGNDIYFLYGNFAYETQARGFNSYREILNRWTPENRNTDIPIVSLDDRNGNRRISTRFLEDGSYFRFRNITLGYNLKEILNWSTVNSCRIYVTAQNALTFTSYPGLDPEIQANANDTRGLGISSDLAVGIDWGTIPAPRTFIGGLQIKF
ncbi:SusC/RagA family TonB-linked outer membrane protein [Portibacter marinus]|uniref:SusC/RagA family TonB-linked outer membrane protein n=1 Tax=Portibacter marinus TaxID=2898660 RepID=UPI001F1971FD|nr:TonB-dependent receptor [Portibacter marinus]